MWEWVTDNLTALLGGGGAVGSGGAGVAIYKFFTRIRAIETIQNEIKTELTKLTAKINEDHSDTLQAVVEVSNQILKITQLLTTYFDSTKQHMDQDQIAHTATMKDLINIINKLEIVCDSLKILTRSNEGIFNKLTAVQAKIS